MSKNVKQRAQPRNDPETKPASPIRQIVTRGSVKVALALVLVHLVFAFLAFDPTPFTGGDNAAYMSLANSLLHEHSYTELYDPAKPPHTQYPPAFPVFVAIAFLLGVKTWVGLKVMTVLFSATAVGFTYLWLRKRREPALGFAIALLLAVSPGVLVLTHLELSDVPFWALTMIALWAFEHLRPPERKRFAVALIATVLAYFTRSAGLPLVIAGAVWFALHRRWKSLAVFAAVLAPLMLLWWLRARGVHGGSDYVQQFWLVNPYDPSLGRIGFGDLLRRMVENDRRYITVHLPMLLFGDTGFGFSVIAGAIGVLGIFGWFERMRHPGVAELFTPLYIGLIFIWPAVWAGERFLLPALPLVLVYAAEALLWVAKRINFRSYAWVGAGVAAFIVLLGLPRTLDAMRVGNLCTSEYMAGRPYACLSEEWQDYFGMAEYVKQNVPRDAALLTRKPRLFYVLSGHPARTYPLSASPDAFFRAARDARARYVVLDHLDGLSQRYLIPVVTQRPDAFCVLYATDPSRAALLGIRDANASPSARRSTDPTQIRLEYCPPGMFPVGAAPALPEGPRSP